MEANAVPDSRIVSFELDGNVDIPDQIVRLGSPHGWNILNGIHSTSPIAKFLRMAGRG